MDEEVGAVLTGMLTWALVHLLVSVTRNGSTTLYLSSTVPACQGAVLPQFCLLSGAENLQSGETEAAPRREGCIVARTENQTLKLKFDFSAPGRHSSLSAEHSSCSLLEASAVRVGTFPPGKILFLC